MSTARKTRIHILNPPGGCGHTSLKNARDFVASGDAEWVGPAIRFLPAVASLPDADVQLLRRISGRPSLADIARQVQPYSGDPNPFRTFARYPVPVSTSSGNLNRETA